MVLPVGSEGQPLPPVRRGAWTAVAGWWGPRPLVQVAVILGVAALLAWLGAGITASMRQAGITPGFAFLWRAAGFQIGETPIPFQAGDTYLRAITVGLVNTLRVAVAGCLLATLLGVAVGVAGLAGNPVTGRLVRAYVETIRNTPLLLQLFFWIALARNLPGPRQALGGGGVLLSNRGIFLPAPTVETGWLWPLLALAALLAGLVLAGRARQRRGRAAWPLWLAGTGLAAAVLARAGIGLDLPAQQGFNIRGGMSLSPEFAALLVALTVKFSAAIAEIVRAGILSVPAGQREAARALGLSDGQILRLVVLPQALRVIVPLITSCFLDLTKDSSLAVAIGYPDLVSILNTTANTTGQAFEALFLLTLCFLALNLSVAALMNWYNARVALRGQRPR